MGLQTMGVLNPLDGGRADLLGRSHGGHARVRGGRRRKPPRTIRSRTCPAEVSLLRLVRLTKLGWRVEQNHQQLEEQLGLDHYEGRGWHGWHHYVTMGCLAHAFLLLERQRHKKLLFRLCLKRRDVCKGC